MSTSEPIRLLIVDDQVDAREWLAEWLRVDHGCQVDTAGTGQEAVELVQQAAGNYDVILMDLRFKSGIDGMQAMRTIRAQYPDIETIIMTAYGNIDDGVMAMKAGAYRYIFKPLNRDEIVILIKAAAQQKRSKAELERVDRQRLWLQNLLAVSNAMQSTLRLDEVLQTIAEAVRNLLGFNQVVVSTVDPDAMVRVRAIAGVDQKGRKLLDGLATPWGVYSHPMQERFRVSRSYLIRHEEYNWETQYGGRIHVPEMGKWADGDWHPLDALRVPITTREGKTVGILSVDDPGDRRLPSLEVIQGLEMFATQAAIAIENAALFSQAVEELERRKKEQQATEAVAGLLGSAFDLKAVWRAILDGALRITGAKRGEILLLDKTQEKLRHEACKGISKRECLHWEKQLSEKADARDWLAQRSSAVVIDDVTKEPWASQYIPTSPTIRSALLVPILRGSELVGFINLESSHPAVFSKDDRRLVERLADLAVVAIKNVEQAERLALVNALALMGAWGAEMVHDATREVGIIRRSVFILQKRSDLPPEVGERLSDIDHRAAALALPPIPEEPVELGRAVQFPDAPALDRLVQAEITDLQGSEPDIQFASDLQCPDVRVAIHRRWLRMMLRHLLHNSIRAMPSSSSRRVLTVRTAIRGYVAEVQVEDTGSGIPADVIPQLFRRPIRHADLRTGRGLLLVRFLAEQYGGGARLVWNKPGEGACVAFHVPIAGGRGASS